MKTVLKNGQECFMVGSPFAGRTEGVMYQRVQVRKTTAPKTFPPVRMMGYSPNERALANLEVRPYPSLLHELIVRQDSIKQVKEKAFVG